MEVAHATGALKFSLDIKVCSSVAEQYGPYGDCVSRQPFLFVLNRVRGG